MENTQFNQIDIRQSDNWAKYLEYLGWNSIRTSSGINVEIRKAGAMSVAKIQRPKVLFKNDLEEIDDICNKKGVAFLKLEPSLDQDINLLTEFNFKPTLAYLTPPTTVYIDLTKDRDALWNNLSNSAKYSIRRAEREGARVEFYKNPSKEKIEEFFSIEQETAKTKKFSLHPSNDLIEKTKIFGDKAFLINVYDKENNLSGGKYYLGVNNTVWYFHGGTSNSARKNKTGYSLVWQSILYLKEQGYEFLDLEGVDDSRFSTTNAWGGFSHFKEKFGGVTVQFPYPHIKYYNKLLKLAARIVPIEL